jgi:hypothetical protein
VLLSVYGLLTSSWGCALTNRRRSGSGNPNAQ